MATQLKSSSSVPYGSDGINHLCRMDLSGAGQITIEGNYAYLGYMYGPEGTSILDISDPRKPQILSTLMLDNPQSHSHKVRVNGDLMVVNCEQRPQKGHRRDPNYADGGFKLYDISDKTNPKLITYQKTGGKGVHRFDMDDKYAYISTEMEGFIGHILVIYDISNPSKVEEVSRWWMPGQNAAAGEEPSPLGAEHRLHHGLRYGNQLYAGCWGSGYAIIDISDINNPKTLSTYDPHPEAKEPSHTLMRVPFQLDGKDIAIGTDEERGSRGPDEGQPHAPLYVFDVSDLNEMKLLSTYHVPEDASPFNESGMRFGAHQFREQLDDTRVFVTWFAAGLRIIDIANPSDPREVGFFIPEPGRGSNHPQTNDVEFDHRGLVYITDKARGFDVIELP